MPVHSNIEESCKVVYSNVDSFLNKKDEFVIRLRELKPHIIGLCEVLPKNQLYSLSSSEYELPQYDMFLNKNTKRGIALYFDK